MDRRVMRGPVIAGLLLLGAGAHAAPVSGQGTWETTLQGRDLDGVVNTFEAYYDTVLDITWLADANYAKTSGYDSDGAMTWQAASDWAANLDVHGVTGWRLADNTPVNGSSYNTSYSPAGNTDLGYNISAPGTTYAGSTASEMAHLFYNTLGNKGLVDTAGNVQSGSGLSNTGPFENVQAGHYWSGSELSASVAWNFFFANGYQNIYVGKPNSVFAWAVRSGDVPVSGAPVPIPAAGWLFLSALGAFGYLGKRKANNLSSSTTQ